MAYLKELYDRYALPIWLTEFSCGDHESGRPLEDHFVFMSEIVPLLDAADHVFRYSWMSARDNSGRRGLVTTVRGNAELTQLGCLWNA